MDHRLYPLTFQLGGCLWPPVPAAADPSAGGAASCPSLGTGGPSSAAGLWDARHQALYACKAHRIPAGVMSGLGKLSS